MNTSLGIAFKQRKFSAYNNRSTWYTMQNQMREKQREKPPYEPVWKSKQKNQASLVLSGFSKTKIHD